MQRALELIAEPRRQAILRLVWDRERSAGEIAAHFSVTRPAISQHLRLLQEGGLVQVRREGTKRIYTADRGRLESLAPLFLVARAASQRPGEARAWSPEFD